MADISLLKPITVFEREFEKTLRLENRCLDEPGCVSVATDVLTCCQGSALVKLGASEVICGIKVKVASTDSSSVGCIVCNVDFNELANREIHPNSVSPEVKESRNALTFSIQRLVNTVICPSAGEQLNIYPKGSTGETHHSSGVYVLKLDVVILHDDGCLLDASLPAVIAALASAKWPRLVPFEGQQFGFEPCTTGGYVTLRLSDPEDWPVSFSACLLPTGLRAVKKLAFVAQPTRRELQLWDSDAGFIRLVLSRRSNRLIDISLVNSFVNGQLNWLQPVGECERNILPSWQILVDMATKYAQSVCNAIQSALTNRSQN